MIRQPQLLCMTRGGNLCRSCCLNCSVASKMSRFVSISNDNSLAVTFSPSFSSDVDFQFGNIIAGETHPFCPSLPPSPPPYTASTVFARVFLESSDTSIVLPTGFFLCIQSSPSSSSSSSLFPRMSPPPRPSSSLVQ